MIFNNNKLLTNIMSNSTKENRASLNSQLVDESIPNIDFSLFGIDRETARNYTASLIDHIDFVKQAGDFLGLPKEHMEKHDISKWTIDEFPFYARNFFGDKQDIDGYSKAWLHHMNHNLHHWGYWIFPDAFTPKESDVFNGVVEMPELFAMEMIADWMGAGMAYQGSWDMSEWLDGNIERIIVHPKTEEFLNKKLSDIGYGTIVQNRSFRNQV